MSYLVQNISKSFTNIEFVLINHTSFLYKKTFYKKVILEIVKIVRKYFMKLDKIFLCCKRNLQTPFKWSSQRAVSTQLVEMIIWKVLVGIEVGGKAEKIGVAVLKNPVSAQKNGFLIKKQTCVLFNFTLQSLVYNVYKRYKTWFIKKIVWSSVYKYNE